MEVGSLHPQRRVPNPGAPRVPSSDARLAGLRRLDAVMGMLHLVQGLFMIVVSDDAVDPVFANDSGAQFADGTIRLTPEPQLLFEVLFGPAVAHFRRISAVAHGYLATVGFERYERELRDRMNPVRFCEHTLSSSSMIVLSGRRTGIWDLGAILLIFFRNASMNPFGIRMEVRDVDTMRVAAGPVDPR